jgi:AAA15 family ATPase/GTPase
MPEHRNLKVSVENFGPVREGEFELKPLTVFIGPNNSGKSYMALLVHAFSQALSGKLHRPFYQPLFSGIPIEVGFGISEEEFVKVAEDIGEQTYRLSLPPRKRSCKKSK